MNLVRNAGIVIISLSPLFWGQAQTPTLPFAFSVIERNDSLPPYVSPPSENLYNSTPGFKVGWGIDYPIGFAKIEGEVWTIFNVGNQYGTTVKIGRFQGPDFEHAVREPDGVIQVPDKGVSTHFLGGIWYDAAEKKLYAPIHCEYDRGISPPAGWSRKKTRLATSTDKGLTWHLEGDILTARLPEEGDWLKYSGLNFEAGPADYDLYIDERGGYFYIFSCNAYAPKNGKMNNFLWFNEVARCRIKDKMAPGKWLKYCDGKWTEPGLGGRASRVCMGSTGIYGRIIYSTYLGKYLRIGTCMGVIDRRFTNLGFTDGSIYISTCDDLSSQKWTPMAKLSDKPDNAKFGFTLADGSATSPTVCGQTMHVYNYWLYNMPSRALDVEFHTGHTPTAGFPRYSSYAYEPLPESGDPIVARKTIMVSCADSGNVFRGDGWRVIVDSAAYRSQLTVSKQSENSVAYRFKGTGVYWRAVAGPDGGKADVFIDGRRDATVDTYFRDVVPFQFAYIKTGLTPGKTHMIEVRVRPDSNVYSAGRMIRHMAFEISAESYRASAGFTSVNGKNNWSYAALRDGKFTSVPFVDFITGDTGNHVNGAAGKGKTFANWWGDSLACQIGSDYATAGTSEAARIWRAPHKGTIRVDGDVHLDDGTSDAAEARITHAGTICWQSGLIGPRKTWPHRLILRVEAGDLVAFVVSGAAGSHRAKVIWDPVVTFVDK
jgi:hypothetical protein